MATHPRRTFPRLLLPSLVMRLVLAGCSSGAPATPLARSGTAPVGTATSAPTNTPTATPPPPPSATPSAAAGITTPSAAAEQALKDVVQRANDAQQRAFAAQDPTPMRSTATAA